MAETITVQLNAAPSTPLNLRSGVVYAPRIATPPFVAYEAVEPEPGKWVIRFYDYEGEVTEYNIRGGIFEVYNRLAQHLRMDVAEK